MSTTYNKDELYHFGYVFENPNENGEYELKNNYNFKTQQYNTIKIKLKGEIIQLCLPNKFTSKYIPIKTIIVEDIIIPEGIGKGDRSGGRGIILQYKDVDTQKSDKITYGESVDWLKSYNETNRTDYDADSIYIKLLGKQKLITTTPKNSVMYIIGDDERGGKRRQKKSRKSRRNRRKKTRKCI